MQTSLEHFCTHDARMPLQSLADRLPRACVLDGAQKNFEPYFLFTALGSQSEGFDHLLQSTS
jgi:hypothetical protein